MPSQQCPCIMLREVASDLWTQFEGLGGVVPAVWHTWVPATMGGLQPGPYRSRSGIVSRCLVRISQRHAAFAFQCQFLNDIFLMKYHNLESSSCFKLP